MKSWPSLSCRVAALSTLYRTPRTPKESPRTLWQLGPQAGTNTLRATYRDRAVDIVATGVESPGDAIVRLSGGSSGTASRGMHACRASSGAGDEQRWRSGRERDGRVQREKRWWLHGACRREDRRVGAGRGEVEAGFEGGANTVDAVVRNSKRATVSYAATSTAAAPGILGHRQPDLDPATCQPILFAGHAPVTAVALGRRRQVRRGGEGFRDDALDGA